jgi:hypothetical protein
MRTKIRALLCLVLLGLIVLAASRAQPAPVLAQPGSGYQIGWWTVDGGGEVLAGSVAGRTYTLAGTIGQPDAGRLGDGGYWLVGGFWAGGGVPQTGYRIFLPIVLRGQP